MFATSDANVQSASTAVAAVETPTETVGDLTATLADAGGTSAAHTDYTQYQVAM